MAQGTCSIDGCERKVAARGWCSSHDRRWRQYGDPLAGPPVRHYSPQAARGAPIEDRFWPKVSQPTNPLDCWEWQAAIDVQSGYGRFQVDGTTKHAHRVAYELSIGDLDPDLELDHLCRNRRCVNPLHLEQVTHRENVRRARQVKSCPQGHPYEGDNLYVYKGHRKCKACGREAVARHYAA